MGMKIRLRPYEHIGAAVRRFKNYIDRCGLLKEMRRKSHYEKASDVRRRRAKKKLHNARNPLPERWEGTSKSFRER